MQGSLLFRTCRPHASTPPITYTRLSAQLSYFVQTPNAVIKENLSSFIPFTSKFYNYLRVSLFSPFRLLAAFQEGSIRTLLQPTTITVLSVFSFEYVPLYGNSALRAFLKKIFRLPFNCLIFSVEKKNSPRHPCSPANSSSSSCMIYLPPLSRLYLFHTYSFSCSFNNPLPYPY